MGMNGTYADHLCISVTSKVLSSTIQIIQADNPDVREGTCHTSVLVVGYLPELQHYVSLEPVERYVPDDYVAVGLTSRRKKKFLYVAKVLQVDGDVQLRFLESTNSRGIYTWPKADDISWQSPDDILRKLSHPTLLPGRGLKIMFDITELEFEKQLTA
ncbi:uncharacterized protein LOC132754991 [Ruditapes philippinarum]|uniref:uncharacterized protein LOC132754991 n=1 Tax=Ruditapes philippinarum TaxID=129788 RepID=UPI00295AFC53|nr:uncharacterized protein LOC132754991 [Ruditapes philippinarum]